MANGISKFSVESIEDGFLEFQSEKAELNSLVQEFMRCIKEQDKPAFLVLFYHEDTPWLGKFDEASEVIACGNNPDVINHMSVFDISKNTFINSMVTPPKALHYEETYSNLDIETDGYVAAVGFDYQMLVNENPIKSGRELWQLIKTNLGWKIVSVVHSIKF
ncbi:hypothetical protein [Ekhidna sp. To15]|uniref:hypothetical protein n=1 Tax=Ekhidna sp. To15 TaxID=3395267 RepID=UPI003F521C3F